jgi:hypothetical protein
MNDNVLYQSFSMMPFPPYRPCLTPLGLLRRKLMATLSRELE